MYLDFRSTANPPVSVAKNSAVFPGTPSTRSLRRAVLKIKEGVDSYRNGPASMVSCEIMDTIVRTGASFARLLEL